MPIAIKTVVPDLTIKTSEHRTDASAFGNSIYIIHEEVDPNDADRAVQIRRYQLTAIRAHSLWCQLRRALERTEDTGDHNAR